jgi:hypothetical protein
VKKLKNKLVSLVECCSISQQLISPMPSNFLSRINCTTPISLINKNFDLIVVGCGSGGFAASLAAARLGVRVLLLEQSNQLGGAAGPGGVNNWEPGVGGTGIPFDLYRRLKRIPKAVGVYSFGRHFAWQGSEIWPKFPGGEQLIDPEKHYIDTLRRFGSPSLVEGEGFRRACWHGIPYEPSIYAATMEDMLLETECCSIAKNVSFFNVRKERNQVHAIELTTGEWVTANFFIDATASIKMATSAGCQSTQGQESRDQYGEPNAPVTPNNRLNGTTLIYRVTPVAQPAIEPLPKDIPEICWWAENFPLAACTQYPNGDFNINSLPTMSGVDTLLLGHERAYLECARRVRAHWHHMQTVFPEFQRFRLSWIASALGVREGPRLIGRYVLTEYDLDAGVHRQTHNDIIAIADHAKDTHGTDTARIGTGELNYPYGIPFRSLLPLHIDNLAVSCRGASFSSIAASSCRLSRTMMQLGQAAGTAAALATILKLSSFSDVPMDQLRASLAAQHVELDWPRPQQLINHLQDEDA